MIHVSTLFSYSSRGRPRRSPLRVWTAICLIGCLAAPLGFASDAGSERLRVVYEFTRGGDEVVDAFLADIEGLQKHSGDFASITVVAYANGVTLLQNGEDKRARRLARLADKNVDFVVCQSSLEEAALTPADLLGFARTVKEGTKEVERLEKQGWARVRDGESYVSHL